MMRCRTTVLRQFLNQTRYGEGSDGHTGGERFEHDEAEGFGFAGENKDIGSGIKGCEVFAKSRTQKMGIWVA